MPADDDARLPLAAAWLRTARIAVYAFMSLAALGGLGFVFHSALTGYTLGAIGGACIAIGGVTFGSLALAAVRVGDALLGRTGHVERLVSRLEALENVIEAQGAAVDLSRMGASEASHLIAATIGREVFPRLVKTSPSDPSDGRTSDGLPPIEPEPAESNSPTALELQWQSAYEVRDLAGCRQVLELLRGSLDPAQIAQMEQGLQDMSHTKYMQLREDFARTVRQHDYESALFTGEEIARMFPKHPWHANSKSSAPTCSGVRRNKRTPAGRPPSEGSRKLRGIYVRIVVSGAKYPWRRMSKDHTSADGGVVRLVDDALAKAIALRASDVHFDPTARDLRLRYRLDGVLYDVDRLPQTLAVNVVARLKVLAGLLTYRIDVPQEGSFSVNGQLSSGHPATDLRMATFPTIHGERAVVRLLHRVGQVNRLDDLGFSPLMVSGLRLAAGRPRGLILVTGPAGSGKSTTLYALAREVLHATPGRSVVSLEDPVEQGVEGITQIQVQPYGELNYVRAMRSLLRQDVQVLLVGEIRDAETVHVVVEAALTGHLMMSTMHSGDPAEAVARLLEMGIAPYQLVSALTLACAQRLVRTICEACGGGGCDACLRTGWRGRTACGQITSIDAELRQAILVRSPVYTLRAIIDRCGPDLGADARRLIAAGRTTEQEAGRVVGDREGLLWDGSNMKD